MSKKILFINSSPNKNGNTAKMAKKLLKDQDYQQLDLVDYKLYTLGQNFPDDEFNKVYEKMLDADVLVIGTPVYWYSMSASLRALLDRLYEVVHGNELSGKDLYFIIQGAAFMQEILSLCDYIMSRFLYVVSFKLSRYDP